MKGYQQVSGLFFFNFTLTSVLVAVEERIRMETQNINVHQNQTVTLERTNPLNSLNFIHFLIRFHIHAFVSLSPRERKNGQTTRRDFCFLPQYQTSTCGVGRKRCTQRRTIILQRKQKAQRRAAACKTRRRSEKRTWEWSKRGDSFV